LRFEVSDMKPRLFKRNLRSPSVLEKISYKILSKSPRYFVIPLLDTSYTLFSKTDLDYEEYVKFQRHKTGKRFRDGYERSWTSPETISKAAETLCDILGKKSLQGVCHGSRFGKEIDWFMENLPAGSHVIGTEIEPAVPHTNTVVHDFHEPLEGHGPFQFVYSNSYDHALDPKRAMQTWINSLVPGGVIVLEHSRGHGKLYVDDIDVFGVETELLPYVLLDWFDGEISVERKVRVSDDTPFHVLYFLRRRIRSPLGT